MIQELDSYNEENQHDDIDLRIIRLIRIMLNENPLDRPSFEVIYSTIEEVRRESKFYFQRSIQKQSIGIWQ
jgi:hypothetical protein